MQTIAECNVKCSLCQTERDDHSTLKARIGLNMNEVMAKCKPHDPASGAKEPVTGTRLMFLDQNINHLDAKIFKYANDRVSCIEISENSMKIAITSISLFSSRNLD